MVGTAVSFVSGSVGEGEFTVEEDRQKLAPVMKSVVDKKLLLALEAGDLPAYRRHLSLQTVHLRGLEIEPALSFLPSDEANQKSGDSVTMFLHQYRLTKVKGKDAAGFCPLHYAAMSGNSQVVGGLLARRADPNRRTTKSEPKLGFPLWMSALDLAIFYKHNDAARLLIAARARLEGGINTSMHLAAISNNAEGLCLLRAAGGNPWTRNLFGQLAFQVAALYGSMAAMEELLVQAQYGPQQFGVALHGAMANCGGSAELVELLISLRADVDFQFDCRRDLTRIGRLFGVAETLKHRVGRRSALSLLAYHNHGQTPLMAAMQGAQYEAAAALIAAGARLDIRNSQNWTAEDFCRGQEIPAFLQKGLEGDPEECRRVASLALPDGYLEVPF